MDFFGLCVEQVEVAGEVEEFSPLIVDVSDVLGLDINYHNKFSFPRSLFGGYW